MLELRPMTMFDIPFGFSLSTQAGWNQTESDWRLLLSAGENGCWIALFDGQPVGTLTTVMYPSNIVWVGMVLVHEKFRRRGIATRLMKLILNMIDDDRSLYLDATPMGEGVYRNLGFEPECRLVRMERIGSSLFAKEKMKSTPMQSADLDRIKGLDHQVFGADRSSILSALIRDYPQRVIEMRLHDDFIGFCLGRDGRTHHQIGPLVTGDLESAQTLLYGALEGLDDRLIILDVPRQNTKWLAFLRSIGFQDQREFTRMRFGKNVLDTKLQCYFAAIGPEFG